METVDVAVVGGGQAGLATSRPTASCRATTSWPTSSATHFLRKRKSSLLYGVGEDAAIRAETIAGR